MHRAFKDLPPHSTIEISDIPPLYFNVWVSGLELRTSNCPDFIKSKFEERVHHDIGVRLARVLKECKHQVLIPLALEGWEDNSQLDRHIYTYRVEFYKVVAV